MKAMNFTQSGLVNCFLCKTTHAIGYCPLNPLPITVPFLPNAYPGPSNLPQLPCPTCGRCPTCGHK